MVSIVGRPNVGKSTLLNRIVGEKVAIVTKVPQTTRNQIRGVYTEERGQIIFIDTPGLHMARDALGKFMNNTSLGSAQEADCIIHLVDANRRVGSEEHMVVERLKEVSAPVIMGLNKVDCKGSCVDEYVKLWQAVKGEALHDTESFLMLPISATTGYNIDVLIDEVFKRLPQGPALYPADTISDTPKKIAVADIIREKLINCVRQEVPHSIAVVVEQMLPRKRKVLYIDAVVLVEKESHKEIVIGKKGAVLKKVGMLARTELEELLERKVFLELRVKYKKHWRGNAAILAELGYSGGV